MKNILPVGLLLIALAPCAALAQDAGTTNPDTTTPSADAAYQYQRQGVFDCNPNGAYAMSVGALGAAGGAYVPVADATVELNTGILVYKECVLREVVVREREAATSGFLRKGIIGIQTGRGGKPLYVQNQTQEILEGVADPELLAQLQGTAFNALNPTLKNIVVSSIARTYRAKTRSPEQTLACPYSGDLNAVLNGNPDGSIWDAITALQNPSCSYLGAYLMAQDYSDRRIVRAIADQENQWNWNRGFYSITDNNPDPLARQILTPGATVQQSFQTLLDSPVRQLESANDVGQMISALFAGVTTQIISDTQGLAGLTKSSGGQSSYLDQLTKESSQGVRNAAINAAIQILNAAYQIEGQYLDVVNKIAALLTKAINDLRGAEKQCWNLIVPKICATSLASDNTCIAPAFNCVDNQNGTATCTTGSISKTVSLTTCSLSGTGTPVSCPAGPKLRVATSTAYSQQVIEPQITPLATTTIQNVNTSQRAVQLIRNLIAGITNTASLDAQRLALQQLDSLVAQHALHNQPDLKAVTEQRDAVEASMQTLVENTVKAWADAPGGWCNVNDQSVIQGWISKWTIPTP